MEGPHYVNVLIRWILCCVEVFVMEGPLCCAGEMGLHFVNVLMRYALRYVNMLMRRALHYIEVLLMEVKLCIGEMDPHYVNVLMRWALRYIEVLLI